MLDNPIFRQMRAVLYRSTNNCTVIKKNKCCCSLSETGIDGGKASCIRKFSPVPSYITCRGKSRRGSIPNSPMVSVDLKQQRRRRRRRIPNSPYGLYGLKATKKKNERTNERFFFINEGNGISTILFYIQSSGKKQTNNNNKNNRKQKKKKKKKKSP